MKITNIEQIDHIYFDETYDGLLQPEMYVIYYSSGRERTCFNYNEIPKTAKAFMKSHYDIIVKRTSTTVYRYKACNIIE